MNISMRSILTFVSLVALATASAKAQVSFFSSSPHPMYYSSLSDYEQYFFMGSYRSYQSLAQSFQAAATGQATSVSIYLGAVDSPSSLTMSLYSVSSQTDTAWTSSNRLANVTLSSASAGWNSFTLPGVSLSAASYYVVEVRPGSGLDSRWSSATTSSFGSFWSSDGTSYSTSSDTLAMSVTGSAVPEPSTYAALFGAAALGCVIYRRHRRSQPQRS